MVTKKDKFLAAAQKFLERGSLDKALVEFLNAVKEDPKDTRTWLRIAELHVKRGENDKATEVYGRTAELYVEQGFFQRAVAVYKNIIKLTPGYVEAYARLAEVYKQLGLLSDAVQQFEQVAAVHQKGGRVKEAMVAMRQIVDINPDQPISRIKLAEAASQGGMVDEAVTEFTRAAELLKAQGRTDEYLRVAERLLYHRPDDVVLAKEIARQYIDRNSARLALAKLQACFKHDSQDLDTLELLARAFEQLGQAGKTISVLKELAKVYQDRGRHNDRGQVAQRILALDPEDAEAREMLGGRLPQQRRGAVEQQGRGTLSSPINITFSEMAVPPFLQPNAQGAPTAQARDAERAAIASGQLEHTEQEASSEAQRIISEADVFVKYGLTERAVDHLRKVFDLLPTHVGAHERLAAVLLQLGRQAEAVAELELLAEQLALSQPEAAANYATRALGVDPGSTRAKKVIETIEGGGQSEEVQDEFEELSTGLIEVLEEAEEDTPQAEPLLDASNEFDGGTEGQGTMIADDFVEPVTNATADENTGPNLFAPAIMTPAPMTTPRPMWTPAPQAQSEPEPEPMEEFPSERTMADDGTFSAMLSDLEQVDFFLDQSMSDDARHMMDEIDGKYPKSPLIEERRARLAELVELANPPTTTGGDNEFAAQLPTSMRPRAMVAAGGDMDVATHRDVGIGYKEMGLFDAAINEFTILAQHPEHEVFALTMIGECHEAKGDMPDAIRAYKQALNRPGIKDAEATQIYYQLGVAFQSLGDKGEALFFFEKVARRDPAFKDVRKHVVELRGGEGRQAR